MIKLDIERGPKCPRCGVVAIKLYINGVPITYKRKYPDGLCRKCKRECILELRQMIRKVGD